MAPRLAHLAVLLALAIPPACRALWSRRVGPGPFPDSCAASGRGDPPRHWLGCRSDPGPPRDLSDEERLLLGQPLDPNRAGARALAFVPGLSPRLARAVVEDRAVNGPFADVEALDRVPGIGPRRLERARAALAVAPPGAPLPP